MSEIDNNHPFLVFRITFWGNYSPEEKCLVVPVLPMLPRGAEVPPWPTGPVLVLPVPPLPGAPFLHADCPLEQQSSLCTGRCQQGLWNGNCLLEQGLHPSTSGIPRWTLPQAAVAVPAWQAHKRPQKWEQASVLSYTPARGIPPHN